MKHKILLLVTLVLLLAPIVAATTFFGYYEGLTSEGAIDADMDIDRTCIQSTPCNFEVTNGLYEAKAQGTDSFNLGSNISIASNGGWTAEMTMGFVDGDGCTQSGHTCGGAGWGYVAQIANVQFNAQEIRSNDTIQYSDSCGTVWGSSFGTPGNNVDSGGTTDHVVVQAVAPNVITISGGHFLSCSFNSLTTFNSRGFGTQCIQVVDKTRMVVFASGLIWNANDGHTFQLNTTGNQTLPAEFDTGLKSFATGLGFISPESQLLFALILIGITEIVMAFFTGFFGENGKWKLWTIHGIASIFGAICTLLGYLPFFVLIIAIVMGTTMVQGGRETFNTFKALARSVRGNTPNGPQPVVQGAPAGAQRPPGGKDEEGEETSGETEPEPVAPTQPEPQPEPEPEPRNDPDADGGTDT